MRFPDPGRLISRLSEFLSTFLTLSLRIVCLIVFFLGIYSLTDVCLLYRNAGNSSRLRFRSSPTQERADSSFAFMEDSAGWLILAEAGLESPVMQGSDNTEYLNRNPEGEFSLSGSLFLDCRNSPDFSDMYSLIYGHHMEHFLMFGALDHYLDRDFFDQNPYGTLITRDGEYKLNIFAVAECSANENIVFNPPECSQLPAWIASHAKYLREQEINGRILGMSTCQYPNTNDRTVVFALIEEKEKSQ